jgi:HAE1 family hydrophobic/amphiphilic exporter-1
MTSIAFLLGVVPLMIATGAGAAARNSLGTTVFGGMLVSTAVNLFFIPGMYVLIQQARAFGMKKRRPDVSPEPAPSH